MEKIDKIKNLMFETNFKADLKYLFNKVKLNTVRIKNGKIKINIVFLKQYFMMLREYIRYIHIKPHINKN